jgi:hypothetical protein
MKIHRFVTFAVSGIISTLSYGSEFSSEELVHVNNLVNQHQLPKLSLNNSREALKYVYGEDAKSYSVKYLRDNYSSDLELAASYHHVIWDQSKNFELKNLSIKLHNLESAEAKLCRELESPNIQTAIYNFLGKSMAIGVTARDSSEAEKQRDQAIKIEAQMLLIKHLKFEASIQNIFVKDQEADESIKTFTKLHPNLLNSDLFKKSKNDLIIELNQRGIDGIKKLKSSDNFFYQTLIGSKSEKNSWKFEETDKLISLRINEQKLIGNCIISDVSVSVIGIQWGFKKLNFRVSHLVRSDRELEVIAVN